jgi:putative SOS response-associated peptidase YedK
MPLILRPENEDKWIDPSNTDLESLRRLLQPYPSDLTEMYQVSPQVGRANVDEKELILPVSRQFSL